MVIGAGKRASGTFSFCRTELGASVRTRENNSYELWHQRMGHPAAQVVGSLPAVSVSASYVSNKACEVCLRAKQARSPFSTSINKTTCSFSDDSFRFMGSVSNTVKWWSSLFFNHR